MKAGTFAAAFPEIGGCAEDAGGSYQGRTWSDSTDSEDLGTDSSAEALVASVAPVATFRWNRFGWWDREVRGDLLLEVGVE